MTCYPGKFLRNTSCPALFTVTKKNLGYVLTSNFQGNLSSLLPVQDLLVIISAEIKQSILSKLQIESDSIEYLFVQIDQPCFHKNQSLLSHYFSGSIAVGIFINQAVYRVDIEKQLIDITNKMEISSNKTFNVYLFFFMRIEHSYLNPYKIFLAKYFSKCSLPEIVKYKKVLNRHKYRTVRISKLLTCIQVSLALNEYSFNKHSGKVKILDIDTVFDYDLFDNLPDGSGRVCAADFNVRTKPVTPKQDSKHLLSKLTAILNCISIICLMITFLIYVLKKKLRTMPGKMNMILIFSLFLTLIVFQLSKFGSTEKWACIGFGVAIHYFWLVSFSSMTACSFHMFRIFRFSQLYNNNHFNGLLKVYTVFVIIFPCVVVVLNIVLSWILSGKENVGYGNKNCFIDNKFSRLATFTIPVGLMCLLNSLFFVVTIVSIRKVPNVPENKSIRSEFRIFCRLFTITGIPWVLQIIDGYLPFSTFSYVTSIINSLQGTAIFAAFVLNKRVIRLLWKSCKLSRNGNSDSVVETNTDDTKL